MEGRGQMEPYEKESEQYRDIRILSGLDRDALLQRRKEDLAEITLLLGKALQRHLDEIVSAREAAEFFNRRKSWIYDAMSRPRTDLQRQLAMIASRQDGGLLFRLSDLVLLRDSLFREQEEYDA